MKQLRGHTDVDGQKTRLLDFANFNEKLAYMRKMSNIGREKPQIRNLTVQIIKDCNCPSKDQKAQALAIGAWVQKHVYYVLEFPERLQDPLVTAIKKAGDCDDFAILIAAMLETIGIKSALITMKYDGDWRHVFAAAILGKKGRETYLPLDATLKAPIHSVPNPVFIAEKAGKKVILKMA